VVFDDATLERIALRLPANAGELLLIQGIGPAKLEHYGSAIVAMVEDALRDLDASHTA
jgi:DNA helicase-2/ATP-dependent DNA helicase PcrA